jgi:hypothetical protein
MNNPTAARAQLLSLMEVAAWQLPSVTESTPKLIAALPAMQRGAVWKPAQTESLWDSLARGFPIGAFLLTPFDPDRGTKNYKFQESGSKLDASHHLLDGQQRATAIALGFLDPWHRHTDQDTRAVLWVDLAPPPENSDQAFIFRVVTRSHPWGYKRNDPKSPISVSQIRKALNAYGAAVPELTGKRPSEIPLTHVWPWDAEAPIPVPMLIDAISNGADTIEALRAKLTTLPFWNKGAGEERPEWQKKVANTLEGEDSGMAERLWRLIEGLRGVLMEGSYGIPALVLPHTARPDFTQEQQREAQDPVEVLFIRVNQAGTRLEGEELIYSILKSIWPEAPDLIEQRLKDKLVTPPRLVLLAARLVLAEGSPERAPVTPDVARFRRLIHGMDHEQLGFKVKLQKFIDQDNRAALILKTAKRLLTEGEWALSPVLAADIAHKAPDIMFLFLRWIDRMLASGQDPCTLDEKAKRRILGMLTALTWFAADHGQCLNALWEPLQKCESANLPKFFTRPNFKKALRLAQWDSLRMLPLPDPDTLDRVLNNCVLTPTGQYGGFSNPEHDFWKNWNRWEWMSGRLTGGLKEWYANNVSDLWWRKAEEYEEPIDLGAKYQAAWTGFIDKLWNERRMLLYVQGLWLIQWFPDYDPTLPEQIEDMNRPWDYDHIHPENYIRSVNNIPRIIKEWHGSIGNLRAWPLELNRMDQDISPKRKLSDGDDSEGPEQRYGMKFQKDERRASFVDEYLDWPKWQGTVPDDEKWFPHQYLARPKDYGSYRLELIRAITTRFSAIYRRWYEQLRIGDLMP